MRPTIASGYRFPLPPGPDALCGTRVEAALSFPVRIEVDASTKIAPLPPIWRFFGADEPNYAIKADGAKLLPG